MLKKFINDPDKVVDEMLEGFLEAHKKIKDLKSCGAKRSSHKR